MSVPRAVVVRRPTEYEELLATHGTYGQAGFFLRARGREIEPVRQQHLLVEAALHTVLSGIPLSWRRAVVMRKDLDRFLFEPEDRILAVGQDGLVANVARYLKGQPVFGVNPDPRRYDGVLVRHDAVGATSLLQTTPVLEARSMVVAELDDGQRLLALNEIFFGHASHQSARYLLGYQKQSERHSSSGVIVASGTGATGWARSIHQASKSSLALPTPTAHAAVFFVREAFPSRATGTTLTEGLIPEGSALELTCELGEGGVMFGDGIEADRIELRYGQKVRIQISDTRLMLAQPRKSASTPNLSNITKG